MRVLLFGATGMVGQGVLRECLLDPEIEFVQTIGRSAIGSTRPKLRELVHPDLYDYTDITADLKGFDACFFCLGVSSAGMKEADYERVTYDITIAAAKALVELNRNMTFIYVSGMGTDSTELGRVMWARVKGRTENALLRMPFKTAYMFRPAGIQPLHGIRSKTKLYQALYTSIAPIFPVVKALFPKYFTTTENVGRAMIAAALRGASKKILETEDINKLAAGPW